MGLVSPWEEEGRLELSPHTQIRGSVSTQHDGALTKNLDLGLPSLQTEKELSVV